MKINGYQIIYNPTSKHANRDGYMYEHTYVAEQMLGRELKDSEVVHHRDKNRDNNSPDNLIVFNSKSDHTSFHRHNCDESLLQLLDDGSYTVNYLKSTICPYCGNEKDKHAQMCINCRNFKKSQETAMGLVTREELKNLIRYFSFVEIGRKYNITDNAVRKYCDKYKLPRTKKQINSYSQEEWDKI